MDCVKKITCKSQKHVIEIFINRHLNARKLFNILFNHSFAIFANNHKIQQFFHIRLLCNFCIKFKILFKE
jgi:hypothetical protein